jgi:hypothetical protein
MDVSQQNGVRQPSRERAPQSTVSHELSALTRPSMLNRIVMILLIVAALLAIATLLVRMLVPSSAQAAIKSKSYQALFLTNGQVYFGKLAKVDDSYVMLKDIYYLQVQQTTQGTGSAAAAANSQTPQVSLAKLGNELHGPEDSMYVSRQQVLFWENIKDDGKVVKAIKDFQASGNK